MFGNLFLGLGPFHMENIAMTCIGKYFWCSDMDIALVEADIYGQEVVQSKVMNGVHYIKGKERMAVIAEAMSSLMFQCIKLENASFELDQLLDSEGARALEGIEGQSLVALRLHATVVESLEELDLVLVSEWQGS